MQPTANGGTACGACASARPRGKSCDPVGRWRCFRRVEKAVVWVKRWRTLASCHAVLLVNAACYRAARVLMSQWVCCPLDFTTTTKTAIGITVPLRAPHTPLIVVVSRRPEPQPPKLPRSFIVIDPARCLRCLTVRGMATEWVGLAGGVFATGLPRVAAGSGYGRVQGNVSFVDT